MTQMLTSPGFWIAYLSTGVLLIGVFFCVIGYHRWYMNWNEYEFPKGLIRVLAAIGFATIFPITLVFYASLLISMAVAKKLDGTKQTVKGQQVRCYQCAQLIGLSDSFCSLCGADQTKTKKD